MRRNHIRHFVYLIAAFFIPYLFVSAQNDELSVKDMKADFGSILNVIEAHPDPYQHISEEDFMITFDEARSNLDKPLSFLEFYKRIASTIALLRDGHSSVSFPEDWREKKRKKEGAFPYDFYLTNDDELYVLENLNQGEINKGAKITAINGITVDSFLNVIDPYISYEKKSFRNTRIDSDFELYLHLAFGHSDGTVMEYFVTDTLTSTVKNMEFKDWKKFYKKNRDVREKKLAIGKTYNYERTDEGVGLITIYSFSVESLDDYKLFLDKTFRRMKIDSLHSLIIDIRGNYGGWPKVSSVLFHYLTDKNFKTVARRSTKVSRFYKEWVDRVVPPNANLSSSFMLNRHYLNLSKIIDSPEGSYIEETVLYNEPPKYEKHEFMGDVYLLTNRDSYSAASSFAATFECYQMGMIIGEETGGTKIFRADPRKAKLKNSDIVISISTSKVFAACYNEEFEGVTPTIEYTPSILEVTSGVDTQLLFAKRIIKRVQKKRKAEAAE